jgi:uncharacterized ion transporter superfamily protein YfcC
MSQLFIKVYHMDLNANELHKNHQHHRREATGNYHTATDQREKKEFQKARLVMAVIILMIVLIVMYSLGGWVFLAKLTSK